jgi:hypothetical protein
VQDVDVSQLNELARALPKKTEEEVRRLKAALTAGGKPAEEGDGGDDLADDAGDDLEGDGDDSGGDIGGDDDMVGIGGDGEADGDMEVMELPFEWPAGLLLKPSLSELQAVYATVALQTDPFTKAQFQVQYEQTRTAPFAPLTQA